MKWIAMLGSFLIAFLVVSPSVAMSPNLEHTNSISAMQSQSQADQATGSQLTGQQMAQNQQQQQQKQQQQQAQQPTDSQKPQNKTFDTWVVANAGTNIHFAPDVNAPILLEAQAASSYPVVAQKNNWDEVQIDSQQVGWVADWVVGKQNSQNQSQLVNVAANTPLSDGPGSQFPTRVTNKSAASYLPLFVSGDWLQIQSADTGLTAWVPVQSGIFGHGELSTAQPLQGKTIVLDPGHGGTDTGAIGKIKSVYERDVNLAVAEALESKLQAAGAKVIMTRTSNDQTVSLADRVKISNDNQADAFISIHQNMFPSDPSVSGTITYYYDAATSKTLADDIEAQAVSALHSNQGNDQIDQDELYVLHHNERPSVLVEGCFLSNPKELDASLEPDFQENLATGIYNGILKYFGK